MLARAPQPAPRTARVLAPLVVVIAGVGLLLEVVLPALGGGPDKPETTVIAAPAGDRALGGGTTHKVNREPPPAELANFVADTSTATALPTIIPPSATAPPVRKVNRSVTATALPTLPPPPTRIVIGGGGEPPIDPPGGGVILSSSC